MMTARLAVTCASVGLALASLSGCGGQVNSSKVSEFESHADDLTTLDFTRTSTPGAAPLNVQIVDPVDVQAIYRATLSLPEMSGSSPCTNGVVHYHLVFKSGGTTVTEIDEEPDGCERVTVPGVTVPLIAGDTYWAKLSEGLGVPESIMYPESSERAQ